MHVRTVLLWAVMAALVCSWAVPSTSRAQDVPAASDTGNPAEAPAHPTEAETDENTIPLATNQDAITNRFKRFEKTLLKMAEYMRQTDPERADLLVRAIGRSKQDRLTEQMEQIVVLLSRNQYGDALDRQGDVITHLQALLELLQSENRKDELEAEKKRIQELLKDLGILIGKEKNVRATTERGGNLDRAADKQGEVAGDTENLIKKIDAQDAQRNQKNGDDTPSEDESEPSNNSPNDQGNDSDGQKSQGQKSQGQKSQGQKSQGQKSQGQQSQGQQNQGQQSQGQQSQGQQSQGQQSQGQQNQTEQQELDRTPGREEIERAKQEMERAIEELKKRDRDQASDHQDEALKKLIEAKEKLEQILRQLREEERQLILAALEARFQKMLAMQLMVYHGTVEIAKVAEDQRTSLHTNRAVKLARDEEQIVLEAGKALVLLREEGSSVAFPEAVEQMQDDMVTIARRLEQTKVDELTQAIEQEIIEQLQEIIEALQKEMERRDQQQQGQSQQGQPQDPDLVDQLAELKMLRGLQLRINRRTRRLGMQIDSEQALEPDLVTQLQKLARRQARIQEVTYNLATGRNE